MAKVVSNILVRGVSGGLGRDLMLRRLKDGRTVLCVKPDFSKRKFSSGQKTHQSRFKEASAYAREAAKTKPIYAELAAGTMKTAYNVALSDWFNPPVIHNVERTGNLVRVEASDNVLVARVQVSVLDEAGKILEKVEAVRKENDWWEATVTAQGRVLAEAWDLAGNRSARMKGEG
jgi:hypothetical protein